MDGGAWSVIIHGVAKSWTQLRDLTFHFLYSKAQSDQASSLAPLARDLNSLLWSPKNSGVLHSSLTVTFHRGDLLKLKLTQSLRKAFP